jgi:hypothetical protein
MARKLSLVYTLALLAVLCTTFVTPVEANNMGAHARMIKKRAGSFDREGGGAIPTPSIGVVGAGNDPNSPNNANSPTDSASGASASASKTSAGASASKPADSSVQPLFA